MDQTQTDTTTVDTGGSNWADWFQNVAGNVLGQAASAKYQKPYDIQSLRLQALGANGYYTEGTPGMYRPNTGMGISPGILLLAGAAVLAVVLLKD